MCEILTQATSRVEAVYAELSSTFPKDTHTHSEPTEFRSGSSTHCTGDGKLQCNPLEHFQPSENERFEPQLHYQVFKKHQNRKNRQTAPTSKSEFYLFSSLFAA
jgi:hypothetical protein